MKKIIFIVLALLLIGVQVAHSEVVRQKNAASYIEFSLWKNDGTLLSGAAGLDSEIDSYTDGSAPNGFTDCTNEATEIGSSGYYYLSLTQGELNVDYATIQIKSSTSGAIIRTINLRTIVGDPLLLATTDDGGVINVTTGAIDSVTTTTTATNVTTVNGLAANVITAASIANDAIGAAEIAADAGTELGTANWATTARVLTAGTNIALAKGTGITGFNDLDAAGVATATWNAATATYGTAGTYGALIETNLDAAISSRSTLVATDNIGINWADVSNPTSTVGLSGTTIGTVTTLTGHTAQTGDSFARLGVAGAGLTAIPWNAAWDAEAQSEATDALNAYDPPTNAELSSAVANVSVDEIQVTALADMFNTDSATTYASAVAGSVVKEIADNAGGSALTAGGIADAVWDEVLSGHLTSGTCGYALNAAGSAGDPWGTALPGSYGSGTAGYIIGNNINATISSRSTYAGGDTSGTTTLLSRLGTPVGASISADIAAVKADTAAVLVDTAAMDTSAELRTLLFGSDTAGATAASQTTIIGYVDTEVAAILEDTGTTLDDLVDDLESRLTATRAGYLDYINTIYGKLPTNYIMGSSVLTAKDDEIDAILVDTATLPSDPADASVIAGLIATVQADLDNPSQYMANVTGMATTANQTTIINHLTDIKGATFSGTTDSLEAIRNRGDSAWITSTLSAATIWANATRTLTAIDEDDTFLDLDSTTVNANVSVEGVGDWTADQKADILEALSVDDAVVGTNLENIKSTIKANR